MNTASILVVTLLAVTACSAPSSDIGSESTAVGSSNPAQLHGGVPEPASGPAPCTPTGYQMLPPDISLEFAYHLRADRIHVDKTGSRRRRVVVEFLEGDLDATLASVDSSLRSAGYDPRVRREQPNGNVLVPYVKRGYGTILVVANATAGDSPSHPAALGTLALDYPSEAVTTPEVETTEE